MCVCVRPRVCMCVYILPFKNDILRCLQALCLHSAFFQPLLFKNQSPANDRPQETVRRITHPHLSISLSLSLFLPERSLFAQAPLSPLPSPNHLPSTAPPSLAGESGLRMPDVLQSEPQQCKHSALPWEQGGLASLPPLPSPSLPPLSSPSLPCSSGCQKGGESTKQQRKSERLCVNVCARLCVRRCWGELKNQEYSSSSVFVFWLRRSQCTRREFGV